MRLSLQSNVTPLQMPLLEIFTNFLNWDKFTNKLKKNILKNSIEFKGKQSIILKRSLL